MKSVLSVLVSFILMGCASPYTSCLENMSKGCGVWVIDMPKKPLMEVKDGYLRHVERPDGV